MAIPVENGDMCDNEGRELTFSELCSFVESSDTSLDFAIKTRILPARTGMDCIQCQATRSVVWMKRLSQSTVPFILFCKGCRKTISLCRNTVLSGSQVKIRQFFQSTYCWLLGLSVKEGASQSGLSNDACQNLYTLNREVCYVTVSRESKVLGGDGLTVEIGDSLISRRRHITRPGQKTKILLQKDVVYIGYCLETKDLFVIKVDRAELNVLLEIIMVMVLPGSKVIIDSCQKYSEFIVENYDISFHNEDIGCPNNIEPRRLKFDNSVPCRLNQTLHLLEQLYFNRKPKLQTASQRFYPFIEDLVQVYPGYGKVPLKPLTLLELAS